MIAAIFKVMWLRLWRDKGALILAFILPGFIFAIFAAIFSNASGGELDLRVSMAVTSQAPASTAFAKEITENAPFSITTDGLWDDAVIRERVRLGQDDVGVIISGDLAKIETAPITVIKDQSREIAATVIMGQIRQMLASQNNVATPEIFIVESALGQTRNTNVADQSVTYYIGATAILFLLFSAMQGASIALDERKSGISDRLLVGPKGAL